MRKYAGGGRQSQYWIDKLHRGAVITCAAVTVVGTLYGFFRVGHYLMFGRPQRIEAEKAKLLLEDKALELKE